MAKTKNTTSTQALMAIAEAKITCDQVFQNLVALEKMANALLERMKARQTTN